MRGAKQPHERNGSSAMPSEKLLDQVSTVARLKHYSHKTELAYRSWIKRFILFHKIRHPSTMSEAEIREFLAHLAVNLNVSSTQTVALSAILFLYRDSPQTTSFLHRKYQAG